MPFGYVEAGAAVVGAAGSLSSGGSGNSPSAAGWETNAMALTDMMGTSSAGTSDPYNVYGSSYAQQAAQAAQLTGQSQQMAQGWNAQQAQLGAQQSALSGQITDASNAYLNSGQQGQYQTAMNALQPAYYGQGNTDMGVQQSLLGQAGQAQGYGNQIMQNAFNVNGAYYNQQYGLEQQQTNANEAARGLAMSGVGAGMSNQADQNFNIAFQNNQLQQEATALGAYDTNNSSVGQLYQGAVAAGDQGLANYSTGAAIPYNTAQTIYGNNQTAMNNSQTALTNQYSAQAAAQAAAQQGWTDQTSALSGQQQALTNQVNNFNAGNTWYNNQESTLMGYYNGSAPAYQGGNNASTANGYAGLGNFLGSNTGQQMLTNGATAAANPGTTYDPTTGVNTYGGTSITAGPTMADSAAIPGMTSWPTYAAPALSSDAAGIAGVADI